MTGLRIDTRGQRCPWPVIRLARAFREGAPSPIVLVADDPLAETDIPLLAGQHGWQVRAVTIDKATTFTISK